VEKRENRYESHQTVCFFTASGKPRSSPVDLLVVGFTFFSTLTNYDIFIFVVSICDGRIRIFLPSKLINLLEVFD
jgi:hypothetical protein